MLAIQVAIREGIEIPFQHVTKDAIVICEELLHTAPDDETAEIFRRAMECLTHGE